ncbi:recombinase family protein [Klebsiella pasteurii]|nr:recombinase family protein [Klebsiella pasteurii]MDH0313302.1 recombinase family protein [Klebsiella pasteurii]
MAQYLRMSTDHQRYSLFNQSEFLREYAEKNGLDILYTYDDSGLFIYIPADNYWKYLSQ